MSQNQILLRGQFSDRRSRGSRTPKPPMEYTLSLVAARTFLQEACANELIDSFSTGFPFDICRAVQPLILSERRNSPDTMSR
jgi:hypothetical protein